MPATIFLVRADRIDPESEQIAAATTSAEAFRRARAFLEKANRSRAAFHVVEVLESDGSFVRCRGAVSWRPPAEDVS
jgi:hypothetical protein